MTELERVTQLFCTRKPMGAYTVSSFICCTVTPFICRQHSNI